MTPLILLGAGCVSVGGRALLLWFQWRGMVALASLNEQALNDRVRALPAGSRLREQHPGRGETVVEVGSRPANQGGTRG